MRVCRLICLGVLLSCFFVGGLSRVVASTDRLLLENEFIKIVVNNQDAKGRFALETTLGSPQSDTDDGQDLIYGKPLPWTSYTTVFVDDQSLIFGNEDARLKRRVQTDFTYLPIRHQSVSTNRISSTALFNAISVTQDLSFYRNPNTNVHDSVLISYRIHNADSVSHNVGLRVLLDTKLGANDGAPFRMGEQAIPSEIKLNRSELFDYWQAFDSLVSPNIIAQGLLYDAGGNLTVPDTIHLANWGSLVDSPWEAPYQQGRSFVRIGEDEKDTALALFFNAQELGPNEHRTIQTVYGLGGVSLAPGELSIGLSTPKTISSSLTEPFLIVGYLLNSGGYDAHQVRATIRLPEALEVVSGMQTVTLNTFQSASQTQFSLRVKCRAPVPESLTVTLHVSSDTFEDNRLSRVISVVAPPSLRVSMPSSLPIKHPESSFILRSVISNPSSLPIRQVRVSLDPNSGLVLAPFERDSKTISQLAAGGSVALQWVAETPGSGKMVSVMASATDVSSAKKMTRIVPLQASASLLSFPVPHQAPWVSVQIETSSLQALQTYRLAVPDHLNFVRVSVPPDKTVSLRQDSDSSDLVFQLPHSVPEMLWFHFKETGLRSYTLRLFLGETMLDSIQRLNPSKKESP